MNDYIENEDINFDEGNYLNAGIIDNEFDNELLNYAIHYAKLGYPVFPLHNMVKRFSILQCSCVEGEKCSRSGKHPRTRNGHKDATTNINQIITWWENSPNANIGLRTGKESGILVLDIDKKVETEIPYDGEITLEEMQDYYRSIMKQNFEPLPETLMAISGSGSRHLYFNYNSNRPSKSLHSKIGADFGRGLDIKSDNGYIIAPPSNHKSGNKYQWCSVATSIENAPKWLDYEIQKAMTDKKQTDNQTSNQAQTTVSSKSSSSKIYQEGERNDKFFLYLCGLVKTHSKEEVLRLARKFSNERCNPPLTEPEIKSTVKFTWNTFRLGIGKKSAEGK